MVHNPGGHWNPGKGDNPKYHTECHIGATGFVAPDWACHLAMVARAESFAGRCPSGGYMHS